MQIVDRATIRLRVWERGAGETPACGTGACAAVVAGIRRGLLDSPVQVRTRGGELVDRLERRRCPGADDRTGGHGVRRGVASVSDGERDTNEETTTSGISRMDAPEVAEYLKQNPKFFEDYADVIAEIFVPHPHGGHAIPDRGAADRHAAREEPGTRSEVQGARLLRDRERPDQREGAPVHARALRGARSRNHARGPLSQPEGRLRACRRSRRGCGAGCRSNRICRNSRRRRPRYAPTRTSSGSPTAAPSPHSNRANGSRTATCCSRSRSCRCALPQTFGVLALGSPDPQRFHPGMGTLYQTRLAELASVATARFLPPS